MSKVIFFIGILLKKDDLKPKLFGILWLAGTLLFRQKAEPEQNRNRNRSYGRTSGRTTCSGRTLP